MKKTLTTIYSGGQYGIDVAALAAARDCGLITGGYAPLGFKTCYGPRPELAKLGLIEHASPNYQPRTYSNVKDSDGTLILAYDFNSPGTVCTKKAIQFYNKPSFDCNMADLPFVFDVAEWIDRNNIRILNVAGNRGKNKEESTKIFNEARKYLKCIFNFYKQE